MVAYDYIGKTKLSRGYSYPVGRSEIDERIASGELLSVTGLAFIGPSDDCRVLCARYSAPRSRNERRLLTLWINAVPSGIRQAVHDLLTAEGLVTLSTWTSPFMDATLAQSQLDHTFTITYRRLPASPQNPTEQLTLTITEDEQPPRRKAPRYRAGGRRRDGAQR